MRKPMERALGSGNIEHQSAKAEAKANNTRIGQLLSVFEGTIGFNTDPLLQSLDGQQSERRGGRVWMIAASCSLGRKLGDAIFLPVARQLGLHEPTCN